MKKTKTNYTRDTKNIWFPEQREPVYDPSDFISKYQFKEYWKRERDRMLNGFHMGNIFVSGWLYWHTVYWKIKMKREINGRSFPVIETPVLRDIDWEASLNFERALNEGKFIELVGSRGFGKTVWQSSRAAWYYTLMDRSQVVVSGGNGPDIKVVTDKIEQGLSALHPMLKKKRLRNDWSKEILAGFKESDGSQHEKSSLSQILIRNYQNGNETMAANGTRPDFHIIDEIGKIQNFIKCVKDSDGCWWDNEKIQEDGVTKPTCLPIFTGTGGDMEVGADSAEMFFKPEEYNILSFDDQWEGRGKIGWFMPVGKARFEYKFPMPMDQYLGVEDAKLAKITILVSNEERCLKEWWEPRYNQALKSGNSSSILSFLAYWCRVPSDSFIVLTQNDYNTEAAKAQIKRLDREGTIGTPIELFHDGERIAHKHSNKIPITVFPVTDSTNKDAPIIIYEFPDKNPPFGLYVAGIDPYRQAKSEYSDSVGVVYIFKRMHDITSERYQNMIVASYAARPDNKGTWDDQARLLIKYYNALALCENDEISFIDYMIAKGDGHYLEDQDVAWIKELVPNTKVDRPKGVHRSAKAIRDFLDGTLGRYMDEVVLEEKDDKGSVIREITGVTRIFDKMLLEEVVKYNKKEGNFDRVVAAQLAIALANKLNRVLKVASMDTDPRVLSIRNRGAKVKHNLMRSFTAPRLSGNRKSIRKLFP